jgi:hypothetical protein
VKGFWTYYYHGLGWFEFMMLGYEIGIGWDRAIFADIDTRNPSLEKWATMIGVDRRCPKPK